MESPTAMPNSFRAASAPRAGRFSLFAQRKGTKRKAARSLAAHTSRGSLCSSLKPGDALEQVLAHFPGSSSGARLAPAGDEHQKQLQ
jgi:hypothetical protein